MKKSEAICDCDALHGEILTYVKNNILCDEYLSKTHLFYKSLADSTRLKIISALYIHEMCVCDISVLLNMTKSAISHQLRYLKDANLISSKRDGKEIFYFLKDDHVREIYESTLLHIKER